MKPAFICETNPTGEVLRQRVLDLTGRLGESCVTILIDNVSVSIAGIKLRHGFNGAPRWRIYNMESPAVVHQTRAADKDFLYLAASSACVCGIEIF